MRSPHAPLSGVHAVVHAVRSTARAAALLVAAVLLFAACGADPSTAPDDLSAKLERSKQARLLDDFINAQGTFCDRDIPGDCFGIDELGIGYFVSYCAGPSDCEGLPLMGIDFGGINAKWWAKQGLPAYPSFRYDGSVTEKRLPDGRRKITASIWSRNTFIPVYTPSFSTLVGADFLEYPTVAPEGESQLPLAGQTTIITEIILPAGYVGMPDMIEALFYPDRGFEVTRLFLTGVVEGPLREDYEGIPAGTPVRVLGVFNEIPGKQDVAAAKAERERAHGRKRLYRILDRINSRLTVTPLRRR